MTKKDNGNELMISKLLVAVMLVAIILAAGIYLWISNNQQPEKASNNTATDQQELNDQQTDEATEYSELNSEIVGDEIDSLDQKINSVNDDALSEDYLSDQDLGM